MPVKAGSAFSAASPEAESTERGIRSEVWCKPDKARRVVGGLIEQRHYDRELTKCQEEIRGRCIVLLPTWDGYLTLQKMEDGEG